MSREQTLSQLLRQNEKKNVNAIKCFRELDKKKQENIDVNLNKIKVLVVGPDPYPDESLNTGAAFEVADDATYTPLALKRLFMMMESENVVQPKNNKKFKNFWPDVLFLNAIQTSTLKIIDGKANSKGILYRKQSLVRFVANYILRTNKGFVITFGAVTSRLVEPLFSENSIAVKKNQWIAAPHLLSVRTNKLGKVENLFESLLGTPVFSMANDYCKKTFKLDREVFPKDSKKPAETFMKELTL